MENNNPKKIRATVVILNHTKAARVAAGVEYILQQEVDFGFKFVITDNSCSSEEVTILKSIAQKHPGIELVVNSKNLGYAKGLNAIKGKEAGDYIFIINPDVLLKDRDVFQKMVNYMDSHPDIAILGPKQINDDGHIAMSIRAFPKFYLQFVRRTPLRNLPMFRKKVIYDEMQHLDYSKTQDVDWLQDSCVIVRRSLWEKEHGYDEKYFLFMSDTEMSVKAWKDGYRVVYYPEVKVWADGKRISEGGFLTFFKSWILRQHVWDSLKYTTRHWSEKNPRQAYYKKQK